ncbi:MAG: PAS domain S-box protein, partial [Aggregatilineales bacterium]
MIHKQKNGLAQSHLPEKTEAVTMPEEHLETRITILENEVEKLKNVSMLLQMAERMNQHYSRQQLQDFSPIQQPVDDHDTITKRSKAPAPHQMNTGQIFEQSASPILIMNEKGRVMKMNPASEILSGYHFYEVKDRYMWEVLVPDGDILRVRQNFGKRLETRVQQLPYTMRWMSKDGHIRHVFWSDTVIYDDDNSIKHIICTGIDITGHRTMLEQSVTQPFAPESSSYTPIIPITEHIISISLVGSIDPTRTMEIIHDMRNGIKQHDAKIAILDVGRLPVITADIAEQLKHIMRAARLLNTYT